ncbi:MAG: hypothetical protein P8Y27_19210 [Chromatiaceae bacterium]
MHLSGLPDLYSGLVEAVNDPFIQPLNTGRGAGLRLTVATQTFADFAALRHGSY